MKIKLFLIALLGVLLSLSGCKTREQHNRDMIPEYMKHPVHHTDSSWSARGKNTNGFSRTNYLHGKERILKELENASIQVINEGHRITVIIPTDKYFYFDTAKLNDLRYKQLNMIVELVNCFPEENIFVAGFTDNVGSKAHKRRLSQHRAQAVVAYLWAHGIKRIHLNAAGYEDKYNIGNNRLIHGSAFNRRVELQWTT